MQRAHLATIQLLITGNPAYPGNTNRAADMLCEFLSHHKKRDDSIILDWSYVTVSGSQSVLPTATTIPDADAYQEGDAFLP